MDTVKKIGWWAYATLMTIVTVGLFARFHLVTVRKRTIGGVRAGFLGCTHVYREGFSESAFLVISTWHGKQRYPVHQIAYAETGPFTVQVESSGGRLAKLDAWQTLAVAAFINNQVTTGG